MFTRQKRMFLFVMAAAGMAVFCCGCSDNGFGWAFYEQSTANIQSDDITKYKTVKIGTQTWTAENLKIKTGFSWCYNNDPSNCERYGRLYDWTTASNICPSGWRLPTKQDWDVLIKYAGGTYEAWSMLAITNAWGSIIMGSDYYGFSAKPGGYRDYGSFYDVGEGGYWWTAGEESDTYAYLVKMSYRDGDSYIDLGPSWVGFDSELKGNGYSVRCIKNN